MRLTPHNNPESASAGRREPIPLQRLLWRSYLKTALIPLFVIELGFLATYWLGANAIYRKNVEAISDLSQRYFGDIAQRESKAISADLEAVASHTRLFASQTLLAINSEYSPSPDERARYEISPEGGLWTKYDNGTTASFYSGAVKIGKYEIDKVWKLSSIRYLMRSIKESSSNISSIYFNSYDSYNIIFPYIDVKNQYSSEMDIPSYNFYYEADADHNPERQDVWTDAYVDPAGHGWMVSSIAPVWRDDQLEGVVGIDITLTTIIDNLLNLRLPWGAYAILVDENGGIIAMPPEGEADFGLSELTDFHYSEAILSDTFKPESFNINTRKDTEALASAIRRSNSGEAYLDLGGARLASFAEVPQTGWKLVVIAPREQIFADAETLRHQLETIGWTMLAILLAFYLIFFTYLVRRASQTSELIAKPVFDVSNLIERIDERPNSRGFTPSAIWELNQLALQITKTQRRLFAAEDMTSQQTRLANDALRQLRTTNQEMIELTRDMSHQIRTPLSIIDSTAQIIDRKADALEASEVRRRASRVRKNVTVISELLARLVSRFDSISGSLAKEEEREPADLNSLVLAACNELIPLDRLHLSIPDEELICKSGASALLVALRELLDNAICHSPPDSAISVQVEKTASDYIVTVSNAEGEVTEVSQSELQSKRSDDEYASGSARKVGVGRHIARKIIEDMGGTLLENRLPSRRNVQIKLPLSAITE